MQRRLSTFKNGLKLSSLDEARKQQIKISKLCSQNSRTDPNTKFNSSRDDKELNEDNATHNFYSNLKVDMTKLESPNNN